MAKMKSFNKNRLKHNQSIKNKFGMVNNSSELLKDIDEDKKIEEGYERLKNNDMFQNSNVNFIKGGQSEKMSEVLLDFAEPLLDVINQDDYEEYNKVIQLTIV